MSTTKQYLYVSNLVPLAESDLQSDDATQRTPGGFTGFYQDVYGPRWFKYIKNQDGSAAVVGQVMGRVADITKTLSAVGTTTTVVVNSTSIATANLLLGRMLIDEKDAAGTAPEGESGLIISNTLPVTNALTITIDSNLPFSAAPGTTAAMRIKTPGWHARSAPASTSTRDILGVVVASAGISNGNFGWVQTQGVCPIVTCNTSLAHSVDTAIIMDTTAGLVVSNSTAAANITLGRCMATSTTTNTGIVPVELTLGVVAGGLVN